MRNGLIEALPEPRAAARLENRLSLGERCARASAALLDWLIECVTCVCEAVYSGLIKAATGNDPRQARLCGRRPVGSGDGNTAPLHRAVIQV